MQRKLLITAVKPGMQYQCAAVVTTIHNASIIKSRVRIMMSSKVRTLGELPSIFEREEALLSSDTVYLLMTPRKPSPPQDR